MLRLATANEIPALNKLIDQSARALSNNDYSKDEIEGAIHYVFGVDTELVEDKTYFVIENNGVIQACGGWSKRKTLFGGNQFNQREPGYLDPKTDAAKIRAFFVHPDYARRGLGTALLNHCEQQALAHGFSKTEMMATLPGVKLYQARGYSALYEKEYLLPSGVPLRFVHMTKNILELKEIHSPVILAQKSEVVMNNRYPQNKLTIVGGGIVGALEAYFAYLDAKKEYKQVRVTIYEKNKSISETTTAHIVPSLTPDEILSVVPRGQELVKKLQILFSEPGGIRVDDVKGVHESDVTAQFIKQVQQYSADEEGHQARTKTLLELGKMSMNMWQSIYDNADSALKKILEESNFNPCREPKTNGEVLHDGYRIDLIYNVPNAKARANGMKADYEGLGYTSCKILSPKEVMARDPFLADFCKNNSTADAFGEPQWKDDAVALWRPGGCIDTQVFLPKFYAYLKEVMGKYINASGKTKDCLHLKFERNVVGVTYDQESKETPINGLRFFGKSQVKHDQHKYEHAEYVFCPGESIGTLKNLGFSEPAYSGFAGASLMLNIPLPNEKLEQYAAFNHCMEVHQEGVVLAWQARFRDNKIFIGVAGTKAFYSDQKPDKDQAFAKNRNLLQLNMINNVLPEFISLALGRNTKGQKLEADDLLKLEQTGIAERWVGTRAVAYDGFPTLGAVYNANGAVSNARCTTHLGSGGGSFSPASIFASRSTLNKNNEPDKLTQDVLKYGSSNRNFYS